MATVQDPRAKSAVKLRFDPPHTDLPLLMRIADLSEVLAESAPEVPETVSPAVIAEPQFEIPAEQVQGFFNDEDTRTTEQTVADASHDEEEIEITEQVHDAPDLDSPRFPRRQPSRAGSSLRRAMALPGKLTDRVFWGSVCATLALVAAVIWFNRDPAPATLPDGWESSQEFSSIVVDTPNVTTQPELRTPPVSEPHREEPSPAITDQRLDPHQIGPTLADPNLSTSHPHQPEMHTQAHDEQLFPERDRPGMATLQGIIEKPDMRATNERTESRLY